MAWFNSEFERFFKQLSKNNNKQWFDENRKAYEKEVKEPFKSFVQEIINRVTTIDNRVQIEPKDAIFRINRDIRFSKDKTPYKTKVSAIISEGGKKNKTIPGIYFELGPNHLRYYTGCYMPDKEQLLRIREEIAFNMDAFNAIITNKNFKKAFAEVRGEKNKIIPKDLKEYGAKQPLIYNKNFYIYCDMNPNLITSDNLADEIMKLYKTSKPFMDFLHRPIIG